jgi:hypothetical protein
MPHIARAAAAAYNLENPFFLMGSPEKQNSIVE